MKNSFNNKQLDLMLHTIELYQNGKTSLRVLIDDLEFLVNLLEGIDNDWKSEFLGRWGALELIYSSNLFHNKNLDDDDKIKIQQSLKDMKKQIHLIKAEN